MVHRRSEADWPSDQSNAVDIGVRVESPAEVFEPITNICYELKLVYLSRSFDDRVRTFYMNPYGFVVTENNNGLMTVNGTFECTQKK